MQVNTERNTFQRNAYRKYQLWWLMMHDFCLDDIFDLVQEWDSFRVSENDYETTFEAYLMENGFQGELFTCFEEFLDCEYQDTECMAQILSEDEFSLYKKIEEIPD